MRGPSSPRWGSGFNGVPWGGTVSGLIKRLLARSSKLWEM